jgi:hypothetical protein
MNDTARIAFTSPSETPDQWDSDLDWFCEMTEDAARIVKEVRKLPREAHARVWRLRIIAAAAKAIARTCDRVIAEADGLTRKVADVEFER